MALLVLPCLTNSHSSLLIQITWAMFHCTWVGNLWLAFTNSVMISERWEGEILDSGDHALHLCIAFLPWPPELCDPNHTITHCRHPAIHVFPFHATVMCSFWLWPLYRCIHKVVLMDILLVVDGIISVHSHISSYTLYWLLPPRPYTPYTCSISLFLPPLWKFSSYPSSSWELFGCPELGWYNVRTC